VAYFLPTGLITALITPFREDERIDFDVWQKIVDAQIEAGVDGVLAAGGEGECYSLSEEERLVALRFCRQATRGRVPVYAHIGCPGTRQTIQLAERAASESVHFLVAETPYYIRPTDQELAEHYIEVCRAVHLPVLAHNNPAWTGVDLTPAIARRIAAACENFAGIRESSGDPQRLKELTALSRERPFAVLIGRDDLALTGMEPGWAGAVTVWANLAPRLCVELLRALRAGDEVGAERLRALLTPLVESIDEGGFPAGAVKHALRLAGCPAGACRRPIGPRSALPAAQLSWALERLRQGGYLPALAAGVRA
jgi:4-hydroxy-tetrahydrodipicolinate synthase